VPALQLAQLVAPALGWYEPAPHGAQVAAPGKALKVPAPQLAHWATAELAKKPALQVAQLALPAAE
jgi:hypothetical protein